VSYLKFETEYENEEEKGGGKDLTKCERTEHKCNKKCHHSKRRNQNGKVSGFGQFGVFVLDLSSVARSRDKG
jgi:hypothetical protein